MPRPMPRRSEWRASGTLRVVASRHADRQLSHIAGVTGDVEQLHLEPRDAGLERQLLSDRGHRAELCRGPIVDVREVAERVEGARDVALRVGVAAAGEVVD